MHFTTRLVELSADQLAEVAKQDAFYSYRQGIQALQTLLRVGRKVRVKMAFERQDLEEYVRYLLYPLFSAADGGLDAITLLIGDDQGRLEAELPGAQAAILLCYDTPDKLNNAACRVIKRVVRPSQLVRVVHEALIGVQQPAVLPSPPPKPRDHQQPVEKLTIMIAEDNLLNQRVLQRVLQKLGYEDCLLANDGLEVLRLIEQRVPDLILMDMEMPGLGGCEATVKIRSLPIARQPHIVALTANAFTADRDKCLEAGMCGYMSKPIEWDRLEEVIRETIHLQRGETKCAACYPS